MGHPILCNVSLGGGTRLRTLSLISYWSKRKGGWEPRRIGGGRGTGGGRYGPPCISTVGHPILCITMYVIRWWHRSHTTKLICNLGPVYKEVGDPR